jgi:hypothetical protein
VFYFNDLRSVNKGRFWKDYRREFLMFVRQQ